MIGIVRWIMALTFSFLACSPTYAEEIYRWTDSDGVVHFSDRPPETGKSAVYDATSEGLNRVAKDQRAPAERTIRNPSGAVAARQIPLDPDDALHKRLISAFHAKFDNPAWVERKNADGIPSAPHDFPEEDLIKQIRGQIAANEKVSSNARVIEIPVIESSSIEIDGQLGKHEWGQAISIPIGVEGAATVLLLVADKKRLYLGLDAFDERTASGFDQFRFYWHVRLTPKLENERLHVRDGGHPRVLRQTNIRYKKKAGEARSRWMKFPVTDWGILPSAEGASSLRGHRQYEASVPLDDAGLHVGIPFSARFEVETDPERESDGSFRKRVYLGRLGSQDAPLWLRVGSAR